MSKIIIKTIKRVDDKNRLLIPDNIMKIVKIRDFSIEYLSNGNIILKPIKNIGGK